MNYKTTPAGRAVAQKYADILNLSRPTPSYKHPRMSLQNRAKIFSPFAALRGYDEEIKSEALQLQLITKPELSDEDKAMISKKLQALHKGMEVTVSYFETDDTTSDLGHIVTITATVGNVNPADRELRLYTGVVNELGKELPVVISFDEIFGDTRGIFRFFEFFQLHHIRHIHLIIPQYRVVHHSFSFVDAKV